MADLPQFPYVIANGPGNLPDADQVMADFQHVRTHLNSNQMAPADLAPGASGQIIVCNGSGVPQYVTPSGDVTASTAGVLTANQRQSFSDATERTTTSGSYVQLAGALQGSVTFGASGGVIFVLYRALWKLVGSTGATAEAHASIHIGGTALPHALIAHGESAYLGLFSSAITRGPTATTSGGNAGLLTQGSAGAITLPAIHGGIESLYAPDLGISWGAVPVEVGAGTHTVDVRYKLGGSDGGTVTVKDRKLAIWALAF